jgi:Mlc titration factor MtfA (ptsG expression regulator)
MIFSWLKRWRRSRILSDPFPPLWLEHVQRNVPLYALLTQPEQAKLRDDLRVFLAERNWEGCGGLKLTDEMKVTIAAQACLLLLNLEHDFFSRVPSILVYPHAYRDPSGERGSTGIIDEGGSGRLGEAWYRGPVVLAWDAVLAARHGDRDGRNLVLHEFAHQLDFLDGYSDGTPPLSGRAQYRRWHDVMTAEYNQLIKDSHKGRATLLDQYGATNPAEFFAVATECFFEKPVPMKHRHPQLYEVLRDYYRQDPAGRLPGSHHPSGKGG